MRRIEPGPGQESVWDYPRPPRLESSSNRIRVVIDDIVIADSTASFRVLETSHPPVFYVPPEDIRMDLLRNSRGSSFCEWKGRARYHHYFSPRREMVDFAWSYPNPSQRFQQIAGYLAFYPSKADACYVDDERVTAQEGDFYGGWITAKIVGPFKGGPNTMGW